MTLTIDENNSTTGEHKKTITCSRCNAELTDRTHRGFIVKTFLFWLPIKRYKCYKCQRKKYVWIN